MDANELMIGDWVNGWDGRWHPVCVSTISSYPEHRPTIVACGGYGYSLVDQVKPIQITNEILRKNGWIGCSSAFNCYFSDYGFCLKLESDGFIMRRGTCINTIGGGVIGGEVILKNPLKYVHELQHALRLAGIKKEIVL